MRSLILTFLDFLFVLLVIVLAILLIYVFTTNGTSVQSWVDKAQTLVKNLPVTLPDAGVVVTTEIPDFFHIEKKNLVDPLPLPSQEPTAVSPLDPVDYRNEVILRTKNFANTLESFFEVNEKLRADPNLLHDEEWLREVRSRLDLFVSAAVDIGKVEPAPAEYSLIQAALQSVGPHAQNLRENYLVGVETQNRDAMNKASEELNQIYDAMGRVESEMVKAGWQP